MIILINGKFTDIKKAKVPIFSEAFMYGYGIFETLRTFDKKPFKADLHIDRLFKSAKTIKLKINKKKSEIKKMIVKVAEKSPHKNQRIKIIAIKNKIIVFSVKLRKGPDLNKGVQCVSVMKKRELPEVKSLSYLSSYLSHEEARSKGFYEAILVDGKNEVFECAYANIFWFEGNNLCTRKDNVLKGITADLTVKISPYPLKYKIIRLEDLLKKKEIFLTSSTYNIVPITKINNKKINGGIVGEKTKHLIKAFSSLY